MNNETDQQTPIDTVASHSQISAGNKYAEEVAKMTTDLFSKSQKKEINKSIQISMLKLMRTAFISGAVWESKRSPYFDEPDV